LAIDRDTASRLGVLPQALDDTLYDAFGQRQVSTIFTQLNQYHVVLEAEPRFQKSPDALKDVYVRSASGEEVPLTAFTRAETVAVPLATNPEAQSPATPLSFTRAPGVARGDGVRAIGGVEGETPSPASIQASFQGPAQAFRASLVNEPLLILAAL